MGDVVHLGKRLKVVRHLDRDGLNRNQARMLSHFKSVAPRLPTVKELRVYTGIGSDAGTRRIWRQLYELGLVKALPPEPN